MAILFSGAIGPIPVSVIMRERHNSELGITEEPIETGAKVTDHAYVEPKKLTLEFGDANAVATFNALQRFQESRQPFSVVTGLTVYRNMLIKALMVERDATYSRVLNGRAELQEIIIVSTAYTTTEGEGSSGRRQTGGQNKAQPGGKNSTRSARPTPERASDAVTKDRTSGTVMRGDAQERVVPANENRSLLSRIVG